MGELKPLFLREQILANPEQILKSTVLTETFLAFCYKTWGIRKYSSEFLGFPQYVSLPTLSATMIHSLSINLGSCLSLRYQETWQNVPMRFSHCACGSSQPPPGHPLGNLSSSTWQDLLTVGSKLCMKPPLNPLSQPKQRPSLICPSITSLNSSSLISTFLLTLASQPHTSSCCSSIRAYMHTLAL